MGQDPDLIRREIEETRERMSETVDAIGYRADVKQRGKEYVADKRSAISGQVSGALHGVAGAADSVVERVTGSASQAKDAALGATGSMQSNTGQVGNRMSQTTQQGAQKAKGIAQENPLGLAIAGAAAGFLIGLLLPSTRVEDERIGEVADEVKGRAVETGQEALEHGKQIAQETAQAAMDSAQEAMHGARDSAQTAVERAKQSTQEHGQQLAETARDNAQAMPGVGGSDSSGGQPGTSTSGETRSDHVHAGTGEIERHGPIGGPPTLDG